MRMQGDYMEEKKKRQMLIIGAALAAVISLIAGWYFTLRKGVYVGERFYYKISGTKYAQNKSNYIELISGDHFKIVSDSGEKAVSFQLDAGLLVFDFSDGASLQGYWNGEYLVDAEGFPIGWENIEVLINEEPAKISNADYCQVLCRIYYDKNETISEWYLQVLGILVYIVGILLILYPNKAHFFLGKWRYNNPELSEAGRAMEQIEGGILVILGIGMMSGILMLVVG